MSGQDKAAAFTRRMIADANLVSGMRVLDIGCGHGLVSAMLAEVVGSSGQVLGIDNSATMIATARGQTIMPNVSFELVDLHDASALSRLGQFDAIVGRRVLMYLADVAVIVARLRDMLTAGGLLAFHEHGATGMPILPASAKLHARLHSVMWQTVQREGADPELAIRLPGLMAAAGLAVDATAELNLIIGDQTPDIAFIAGAMLSRIEAQNVATSDELKVDTLTSRLEAERSMFDAVGLWELMVATIGRTSS